MDTFKNMKKRTKIIAIAAICVTVVATLGVIFVKSNEKEDLAKVAEIQAEVDVLFTDENKDVLSTSVSQETIDGIYTSIEALRVDISKNAEDELEAAKNDLDVAQSLFTMQLKVAELFDEQGVLKADADIASVEEELATYQEDYPEFFEVQQGYIEKAKAQEKEIADVTAAMNTLFTDETRAEVRHDVTREAYEEVLSKVEGMTIIPLQSQFMEQLKLVEEQVEANEEATEKAEAEAKAKAELEAEEDEEEVEIAVATGDSPYFLYLDKSDHIMTVYGKDDTGNYTVPVKKFSVATGSSPSLTPVGTFTLGDKEEWHTWTWTNTYSPYCTEFDDGLYIHGPIYNSKDFDDVQQSSINEIGTNATSGCIRMYTEDCKWIYQNCPSGTKMQIVN